MEQKTVNKMGSQPIPKVMLGMGLPIVLSMILQACYNIVDSIFVAKMPDANGVVHLGEYAVNALTLAFPIQMLIVAFGIGTGVGVNALLSKSLGQGDKEKVAKIAGNGVFLGLVIYVCFCVFGIFGINIYLQSQKANELVLSMGNTYLSICTFASIGILLFAIYEKLLQSTGKTVLSTIAQVAGAVTNIVLDPIMIYGLLGCPAFGIAGAAYATVIGQIVSMLLAMIFHYKINHEVRSGVRYLKPEGVIIKEIYKVGFPAIIMQALMSLMTYGVNIIFNSVSMAAVTAYGIFYKIQQFIFFASFGLRDAITPIVAYNYGMKDHKRVKEAVRCGIFYTTVIMIVGTVALQVGASILVGVFGLSDETARLCELALHIISVGFIFAGANTAIQGVLQALGRGVSSLVISMLRLCVIVLPLCWIFTQMSQAADIIWYAFPIAELGACIASIFLLKKSLNISNILTT